jgi:hypothetical protein
MMSLIVTIIVRMYVHIQHYKQFNARLSGKVIKQASKSLIYIFCTKRISISLHLPLRKFIFWRMLWRTVATISDWSNTLHLPMDFLNPTHYSFKNIYLSTKKVSTP